MWTFGDEEVKIPSFEGVKEEGKGDVVLCKGYIPKLKIHGVDHRELQLELLKVLAKYKAMSILDLSKRSKISVQRILRELPYLPKKFFSIQGERIILSDKIYNLSTKEITKMFKTDV